jgi:pimeloyl-ACP methyl ester carboxylesterase
MSDFKKTTGTFKSFDETEIYYEVRGSGKPIILCYGLGCLMNHWIHQMMYFAKDYQTVVLDYRGHHGSATPADRNQLTIEAICRDINGLVEHLKLERASFWGHSLGVQILLRYYDMFPETVDSMVFINGFATNPFRNLFGVDVASKVFHLLKEGYRSFPETLRFIWRAGITNPLAVPLSSLVGGFNLNLTPIKDIEVYARGVASLDPDVFMTFFEQMMAYDASPVLDKIKVPVLIISGSADGVTPESQQEEMHQRIAGSELLRVPYGSHCTQLDLPDFVNLRAEKFLHERAFKSRTKKKSLS